MPSPLADSEQFLLETRQEIENRLNQVLPDESNLSLSLVEAMRYSVLNGGKRLRGLLVCATAHAFSGRIAQSVDCAAAIEIMHAYSLVHDDLPSMDDAETRRGKPSCHVVYGDDIATLVGDALQALTFEIIVNSDSLGTEAKVVLVEQLARASGYLGMVGGQAWDVSLAKGQVLSVDEVRRLQGGKTGALFVAAVEMGYCSSGETQSAQVLSSLRQFATMLGEGFQVVDDLLDLTQSEETTGKPTQRDASQGKCTLPEILGIDEARRYAEKLLEGALAMLNELRIGEAPLAVIARQCVERIS